MDPSCPTADTPPKSVPVCLVSSLRHDGCVLLTTQQVIQPSYPLIPLFYADGTNINDVRLNFGGFFDTANTIAHFDDLSDELTHGSPRVHYVCPSDIAIDRTFGVSDFGAQLSPPLFDADHADVVQKHVDLTNPRGWQNDLVTYDISRGYAHGGSFDPDIWMRNQGFPHLNIIDEQDDYLQTPPLQGEPCRIGSKPTERQKRPQIVRDWLSAHASWPYPTPAEKTQLVATTGYTERQLKNCLSNLRTREKHLLDSHTNGQNGGNVTCRQPCDVTPTTLDHVQSTSTVRAHQMLRSSFISPPTIDTNDSSQWPSPFDTGYPTPDSTPGVVTQIHPDFEADATCQTNPSISTARNSIASKRKGRRHRAQTYQAGIGENTSDTMPIPIASSGVGKPKNRFFCTVVGCYGSFKNASDWKRHEAGVHGYSDREWICMLTEAFKTRSECVFCSESMDSVDHLTKHLIAPCSNKCTIERTFFRKDLLKQHVLHVHLAGKHDLVRDNFKVPQEWSREVESSAIEPDSCWCGFCGRYFESVTERMDHVAQHFREGLDMRAWNRR
ncbi:hypothetical protein IG631_00090 [Alternaria alternata]|nr:hypothetical protein IG631_00090 [Alternaria alternata]